MVGCTGNKKTKLSTTKIMTMTKTTTKVVRQIISWRPQHHQQQQRSSSLLLSPLFLILISLISLHSSCHSFVLHAHSSSFSLHSSSPTLSTSTSISTSSTSTSTSTSTSRSTLSRTSTSLLLSTAVVDTDTDTTVALLNQHQRQHHPHHPYPWPSAADTRMTYNNNNKNQDEDERVPFSVSSSSSSSSSLFQDQSYYSYTAHHPIHPERWHELCFPVSTTSDSSTKIFSFLSSLPSFFSQQQQQQTTSSALDITLLWSPDDDETMNPHDVAKQIIQQCVRSSSQNQHTITNTRMVLDVSSLEDTLTESIQAYSDFCHTNLQVQQNNKVSEQEQGEETDQQHRSTAITTTTKGCHNDSDCDCSSNSNTNSNNKLTFKCRLVASRGNSGAKCPQYHIDSVPCRWIQTFVGPGVDVVEDTNNNNNDADAVINWEAFRVDLDTHDDNTDFDDDDDDDEDFDLYDADWNVNDQNKLLIDSKKAKIYHTQEGEAILMAGSQWNKMYSAANTQSVPTSTMMTTKPVVHKSPECENGQYRILFTQDIVFQ